MKQSGYLDLWLLDDTCQPRPVFREPSAGAGLVNVLH